MPPTTNRPNLAARYGITARRRSDKPPSIPKWANWGWLYLPLATRVQIFAVFFGAVALTTPFWVYVNSESVGYLTFGLWHLCISDECTSIHDNLVPNRDVPAWYFLVQGTYTIGVVGSCICLGILTHNADEGELKMSPIVHRTAFCLLCITVFQQFVGIYTFVTYLDDTDFLYDRNDGEFDFHGSFYCATLGIVLCLVTTVMFYFDDEITKPKKKKSKLGPKRYQPMSDYMYNYDYQSYPGYQYMEKLDEYPIRRQPYSFMKSHNS